MQSCIDRYREINSNLSGRIIHKGLAEFNLSALKICVAEIKEKGFSKKHSKSTHKMFKTGVLCRKKAFAKKTVVFRQEIMLEIINKKTVLILRKGLIFSA